MTKVLTLLFISVLFVSCSDSSTEPSNDIDTSNREIAPDFDLTSLDHGNQTLSQYQGKVVFLYFLGYNCTTCLGHAPSIQTQIYTEYDSSNFQILGLDVWNGNIGGLANFRIQTGVEFPLLLNAGNVGNKYNARNDYSVIVDKEGKIAFSTGGVNISEIKKTIDALLGE